MFRLLAVGLFALLLALKLAVGIAISWWVVVLPLLILVAWQVFCVVLGAALIGFYLTLALTATYLSRK